MTDNNDLLSLLSSPDKENADWAAISAALKWAMDKLIKQSEWIRTYSAIDKIPENILDAMAVELRTQYYDESLPIETKRKLVKNTMKWYSKAGTPASVKELIQTVFGSGQLVEWFDSGGEPFTFEIKTDTTITPTVVNDLERMILKVKNTRSHLSKVVVRRVTSGSFYVGGAENKGERIRIVGGFPGDSGGSSTGSELIRDAPIGVGAQTWRGERILIAVRPHDRYQFETGVYFGTGAQQARKYKIAEGRKLKSSISAAAYAGGGIQLNKKYVITTKEVSNGTV